MNHKDYVIVVGMDFSSLADRAFAKAYELGAARERAVLHVVHVAPAAGDEAPSLFWGELVRHDRNEAVEQLATQLHQHVEALFGKSCCSPTGSVRIVSHLRFGDAATSTAALASELQADLIVLGTQGQYGFSRWLLGSVAEGVIRHAHAPVLVVPPNVASLSMPEVHERAHLSARRIRRSFPAEAVSS